VAAEKKIRFCPAAFYSLLSFGNRCIDRLPDEKQAPALAVEFGNLGASVRAENATIIDYFAYSREPDGGAALRAAYAENGGRRFRLTRQQIKNNIWNVR